MLKTLRANAKQCLTPELLAKTYVVGHQWGDSVDPLLEAGSQGLYDTILAADCLWMPEQHAALCNTLVATLRRDTEARIHCVAGFHSGRRNLAPFFTKLEMYGLVSTCTTIEMNLDGNTRPWDAERPEEDLTERKRWLVVSEHIWSSHSL